MSSPPNPFDTLITIDSVTTKLPTEFIDIAKERLKHQEKILEERMKDLLTAKLPNLKIDSEKKKDLISQLTKEFLRMVPVIGSVLASGVTFAEYIKASDISSTATIEQITDSITAHDIQNIVHAAEKDQNPELKIKDEMIKILENRIQALRKDLEKPVELQPGNSTVQIFTIKTKKSTFFRPSIYTLHIEIQYSVDNLINRDVVEYALSIVTSIGTMIWGACIGSCLGYVVRDIFTEKLIFNLSSGDLSTASSYILFLIANILLGIISVIVFARKKDIQPLLTIEDFWGGILLGFVVGYTGKGFLEKLLPSNIQ